MEHIEPLTKAEMIEFFKHYISPNSPHRSKLSVHLLAQSSPRPTDEEANGTEASGMNGDEEIVPPEQKPTTVIEDVPKWKTSLPVSAGAKPVKDLSEFEETEAKL